MLTFLLIRSFEIIRAFLKYLIVLFHVALSCANPFVACVMYGLRLVCKLEMQGQRPRTGPTRRYHSFTLLCPVSILPRTNCEQVYFWKSGLKWNCKYRWESCKPAGTTETEHTSLLLAKWDFTMKSTIALTKFIWSRRRRIGPILVCSKFHYSQVS